MNYLCWSKIDLENGLGGIETHARALAREFRKKGINVVFSQDPLAPWQGNWDVIHTHGAHFHATKAYLRHSQLSQNTIWVHTLHGWTHERMAACWDYFWPGAYPAIFTEYVGATRADHVFAVHESLSFLQKIKSHSICSNGWDSWENGKSVRPFSIKDLWLFVGRGSDPAKGVDLLLEYTGQIPMAVVPGEGFEHCPNVERIGKLNSLEMKKALTESKGLVICSRYEGLPVLLLEALALGIPVVSTKVGGIKTLSPDLQGISYCNHDLTDLVAKVKNAETLPHDSESVRLRAQHNRKLLKTWADVSNHVLQMIEKKQVERKSFGLH